MGGRIKYLRVFVFPPYFWKYLAKTNFDWHFLFFCVNHCQWATFGRAGEARPLNDSWFIKVYRFLLPYIERTVETIYYTLYPEYTIPWTHHTLDTLYTEYTIHWIHYTLYIRETRNEWDIKIPVFLLILWEVQSNIYRFQEFLPTFKNI